jgi:hypothetical protein
MSELLFQYHSVHATTWVYLSSLLMLGLFFKFNRFWSVRNLDLMLLILLSPGLLLVYRGERMMEAAKKKVAEAAVSSTESIPAVDPVLVEPETSGEGADESQPGRSEAAATGGPASDPHGLAQATQITVAGYVSLLISLGILLVRLLFDPTMVRRPLLEPNLSTGGLAFLGCSLFVFLMANVINGQPTSSDLEGPRSAARLISRVADDQTHKLGYYGPGNAILHFLPALVTDPLHWEENPDASEPRFEKTAKFMALFANLAIVLGIVLIGFRHFGSTKTGLGAAALYLMLPYNNLMAGNIDHVLPAALLVWAILSYRQPLWAGVFIGLSIGVVYYPLFLLPLWISFYWERGLMRFLLGVGSMLLLAVGSLVFVSADTADFLMKVRELFGIFRPRSEGLEGIWLLAWDPAYRYPVMTACIAVSIAFALWPAQKNLGTLLSCSAAVMVATQFWHGNGGGVFMAWFLPLTLLTIFRPNLEDRVALSVLGEGWFPRRKLRLANVDQAA